MIEIEGVLPNNVHEGSMQRSDEEVKKKKKKIKKGLEREGGEKSTRDAVVVVRPLGAKKKGR